MKLLRVFKPFLGKDEIFYLKKCINTNWISSEGPFVKQFEKKTAKLLNRKYGIAVSNGTAALQIAFQSLNLKKWNSTLPNYACYLHHNAQLKLLCSAPCFLFNYIKNLK